ncbi:site-specific DNA-methyltransferase [Candidatus Nomurabacteria bacterium]|jgi:adenine-specific DNA-methyltransferase|nr:site-specific DNA-methyltransferase [Candidatus Nomurabacteria bacterium]
MSQHHSEKELLAHIKDLENEIKKLKDRKKFGLVWENKPEEVVLACEKQVPIIKEVKNRKLVSDNLPLNNVLIEGDNYHSLSVLNYTHRNKIDVIYIDPPYNTGSSAWVYNNNYIDENDSYRHSKWVSMMKNRLELAKNLLTDNGFIVCAIDHYELFTLGLLMDEIFGESNRIGIVSVVHKSEGRNQEKFFGTSHEYMLFYSKNKQSANFAKIVLSEDIQATFDREDKDGLFRLNNYLRSGGGDHNLRKNKPHFFYPIYVSSDLKNITIGKQKGYEEILPITSTGQERTWKTTKETFLERLNSGQIIAERDQNNKIQVYEKYRESQVIKTHWIDPKYHAIHYGTKVVENILGGKKFDFPKSLYLLIDTLKLTSTKNSTVLDFFAGSGTTGHAVLELNKQDGGKRKFILCTNNENNIAEEVTYERLKRVIKGYKNKKGEKVESLGGNLSYYKTDLVDIEKLQRISDESKIKITYQAGEMIAIRENTLNESDKNDWWQIFENDNKKTAIYFKEDKLKLPELVKILEKEDKPTVLYIFGWGKNEYKNEYSTKNIKVEDIPEPIIEVYKEINRI